MKTFRYLAPVLIGFSLLSMAQRGPEPAQALTGTVTSSEEGKMEGVLVSAKREGSKKIITVVSNAQGMYSFPRNRLEPGNYAISIRAVGYVLPASAPKVVVNVTPGGAARQDLSLRRSNVLELAMQLTDPEWLMNYPLDDKTKFDVFRDCSRCHTLQRPSMSTYNAEQMAWVMKRMNYSAGSTPMTFQLPGNRRRRGEERNGASLRLQIAGRLKPLPQSTSAMACGNTI